MKFIILKKRIQAPSIGAQFEDRLDIKSLEDLNSLYIGKIVNDSQVIGLSIYDFKNHTYLSKKQAEFKIRGIK